MALSDERIDDLAQNYGLDWLDYEPFARAIEAEVRKDDETLIRQLVEALEASLPDMRGLGLISPTVAEHADKHASAITAGRARLEGKP